MNEYKQPEAYIEKLKVDFYRYASGTNDCAEQKDVNRNHVNYGSATTIAGILIDFGCKVELPVWEDSGYLKIPFIQVDDWRIEFDSHKSNKDYLQKVLKMRQDLDMFGFDTERKVDGY